MLAFECNKILARRHSNPAIPPPQCGEHWPYRFIDRYPEFQLRSQNPKEQEREAAEDSDVLEHWFREWEDVIIRYSVLPSDTYNYDEMGVRIGISKKQKVITTSGDGSFLPPMIILQGKRFQKRWVARTSIKGNYPLGIPDSGYSNCDMALAWIQHFDKWSARRQQGASSVSPPPSSAGLFTLLRPTLLCPFTRCVLRFAPRISAHLS